MQTKRVTVVQELARRAHCSLEEADEAYETELAALEAWAKVHQYVAVFASRNTLDRLLEH